MKKNVKRAYIILSAVFILFNFITFAVPIEKTATFWIGYAFTFIAFALQIITWNAAFKADSTLKSKLLGIPIVYIGLVYLIAQLIAFAVFCGFPVIPSWIAVIVGALILGITAFCLLSAGIARNEINRVEEKVNQKVIYIRELQADVEILAEQENNSETKAALLKLAEKIRYSDPTSSEALGDLEAKISEKVMALKTASNKSEIISELDLLLTQRNKRVKILKYGCM